MRFEKEVLLYINIDLQVTAVEFLGHVGGMGIDAEISKMFQKICVKQGLKFKLHTKVMSASRNGDKVRITVENVRDGKTEEVSRNLTKKVTGLKFLSISIETNLTFENEYRFPSLFAGVSS